MSGSWEIVHPDANYHYSSIKWQTGTGFQSGKFQVVLSGTLATGMLKNGVKPAKGSGTLVGMAGIVGLLHRRVEIASAK